jgi:hypothetical protein
VSGTIIILIFECSLKIKINQLINGPKLGGRGKNKDRFQKKNLRRKSILVLLVYYLKSMYKRNCGNYIQNDELKNHLSTFVKRECATRDESHGHAMLDTLNIM